MPYMKKGITKGGGGVYISMSGAAARTGELKVKMVKIV